MFQLTDKTAIITGAGSGIGRAIAGLFARQGARVFLFDVDAMALKRLGTQICNPRPKKASALLSSPIQNINKY